MISLEMTSKSIFRIPDAINMLDNERTRFVNGLLFFAMGYQLVTMILSPDKIVIPYPAGYSYLLTLTMIEQCIYL